MASCWLSTLPFHSGVMSPANRSWYFIPFQHQHTVSWYFHNTRHPGKETTHLLSSQCVVWPDMKFHHCTKSTLQLFTVAHIVIVRPLPPSHGYTFLLTCINCFTQWVEAIPISRISAKSTINAFLTNWVSPFGVPHVVFSDHGTQFNSKVVALHLSLTLHDSALHYCILTSV